MLGANDAAALYKMRNDDNAFCAAQYFFWNSFIGSSHDGVEYICGHLKALNRVLVSRRSPETSVYQRKSAHQ
jgi:hypothetical protein